MFEGITPDIEQKIHKYKQTVEKLLSFCEAHINLYIYGAGKFGKRYYDLLKDDYKIKGFIVSDVKDEGSFQGLPIIAAANFPIGQQYTGIIPAFKGSDAAEIESLFPKGSVDVFNVASHDFISYYSFIKPLAELHDILESYGTPASLPLPPPEASVNILIIRLDSIGDVICTTPLIREIRSNYQNAFITVVIGKKNEELLQNCPYIDELLLYDVGLYEIDSVENSNFKEIKSKADSFAKRNFKRRYDIAIEAKEFMVGPFAQQEVLARASGAKWIIGHAPMTGMRTYVLNFFSDVYTRLFPQYFAMHEIVYQLEMLRECGLKVGSFQPELWPSVKDLEKATSLLNGPRASKAKHLVAVGISGSVPRRSWPEKNWATLFCRISDQYGDDILFILLGGKDVSAKAAELEQKCTNVLNCVGKCSLNDTAVLIQKCTVYLGSNTGMLHMAAATKTDAIVLYADCLSDGTYIGSAGPCRWGALGVTNYSIIPPGGLDGCHGVCSKSQNEPHCINQIEIGQVEMALRCMLNRKVEIAI